MRVDIPYPAADIVVTANKGETTAGYIFPDGKHGVVIAATCIKYKIARQGGDVLVPNCGFSNGAVTGIQCAVLHTHRSRADIQWGDVCTGVIDGDVIGDGSGIVDTIICEGSRADEVDAQLQFAAAWGTHIGQLDVIGGTAGNRHILNRHITGDNIQFVGAGKLCKAGKRSARPHADLNGVVSAGGVDFQKTIAGRGIAIPNTV